MTLVISPMPRTCLHWCVTAPYVVDSNGVVGSNITIDVALDADGKTIPNPMALLMVTEVQMQSWATQ